MRRKLLIVDLEATCWERGRHQAGDMETIEIGALLVEPEQVDATPRSFQTFVRPVRSGALSDYCVKLTGIRQADVDGAETFPAAFARFLAWLGDPALVRFSSWGRYDKSQLQRDCTHHAVRFPFTDDHFNIKKFWSQTYRNKSASMSHALERMGLALEGAHHRGLDDARNIWRILRAQTGGDLGGIV
jgi:inhibitor of KinA sporulation pathway (predicted exonuclease)